MKDDTTENKKYISSVLDFFSPELLHQEKVGTRSQILVDGRKVAKNSTRQNNFKRGVERNNMKTFTIDLSVTRGSERQ